MVKLSDEEWADLLATLRTEVIRSGYADWDRSAFAALETNDQAASFESYLTKLIAVLKIGSGAHRQGIRAGLSELLRDADNRPVVDATLIDDEGYEQDSLLDGRPTDALLSALADVHTDLFTGGGGYYGGAG